MPKFSKRSMERLETCHPDLQALFLEVIKERDCSVICGVRSRDEQEAAFRNKTSKARFGQSPHNYSPSYAVDVVYYPVDWDNIEKHQEFMKYVKSVANKMGKDIECGGEWTTLKDYPHYEIRGWNKIRNKVSAE